MLVAEICRKAWISQEIYLILEEEVWQIVADGDALAETMRARE